MNETRVRTHHAVTWPALLLSMSCQSDSGKQLEATRALSVPAADLSATCYDVGGAHDGARVCRSDACKNGVCLVKRTTPEIRATTEMGFRCVGSLQERLCFDRRDGVGAFACEQERCVQPYPRVPDASEWWCADAGGAQLCLRRHTASGVRLDRPEAGFLCGERKTRGKRTGEMLCIDYAPDFPDGHAGHWSCHYQSEPRLERVCLRETTRALGAECNADAPCIAGNRCISGHCVPYVDKPNCWLDADCESRRCRLGACL